MDDVLVRLSREEIIRMKVIAIDKDREGALYMVSELLRRAETAQYTGLKNRLDK